MQESQKVSPFPAGDHKAARNRRDSVAKTNTKHTKKRSIKETPLELSEGKLLAGLNMFYGTNLTLNVDQDT